MKCTPPGEIPAESGHHQGATWYRVLEMRVLKSGDMRTGQGRLRFQRLRMRYYITLNQDGSYLKK